MGIASFHVVSSLEYRNTVKADMQEMRLQQDLIIFVRFHILILSRYTHVVAYTGIATTDFIQNINRLLLAVGMSRPIPSFAINRLDAPPALPFLISAI